MSSMQVDVTSRSVWMLELCSRTFGAHYILYMVSLSALVDNRKCWVHACESNVFTKCSHSVIVVLKLSFNHSKTKGDNYRR